MKITVFIAAVFAWALLVIGILWVLRRWKRADRSGSSDQARSGRPAGETVNTVMGNSTSAVSAFTSPPLDVLNRRLAKGRAFARSGHHMNALTYYLWCYHAGGNVPEFNRVRRTALLREWMELGRHFVPALEAAREERNRAEQKMLSTDADEEAARDFAALNRHLKEAAKTLELYDGLPPDDPRRLDLSSAVFDELVTAQRYTEAVQAKPYESMSVVLEDALDCSIASPGYLPSVLVRDVARSVEALAGSGDIEQARRLADRVLTLDGSPQAWEILKRHAVRAGRVDVLPPAVR